MSSEEASLLREELIDAAAAHGDPALYESAMELLRLASFKIIEPDESRPETLRGTASISRSSVGRYHVKFYRSFLEGYLKTSTDRLFVLLHELAHWRQADLIRGRLLHPQISNTAMDMLINARLCRRWFPEGVPFFRESEAYFPKATEEGAPRGSAPLFSHLIIPPMTLFAFYAEELRELKSGDQRELAAALARRGFSYQRYHHEEYYDHLALLIELFSHLKPTCQRACVRELSSIYASAWLGKPSLSRLYDRVARLMLGRFEPCVHARGAGSEDEELSLQALIDSLTDDT